MDSNIFNLLSFEALTRQSNEEAQLFKFSQEELQQARKFYSQSPDRQYDSMVVQIIDYYLTQPTQPAIQTIHDTQTIMSIYMQRPKSINYMSLGCWFAGAHAMPHNSEDYKALRDFGIFTIGTKRYLAEHGLNRLPLEPLEAYNKAWTNKGEKK